jgi:hypothetical protein
MPVRALITPRRATRARARVGGGRNSEARREYHIYQPYNPAVLAKLIEVLRVYYNYVITGSDRKTPAMRLGLCSRPATPQEILGFRPRIRRTRRRPAKTRDPNAADPFLTLSRTAFPR